MNDPVRCDYCESRAVLFWRSSEDGFGEEGLTCTATCRYHRISDGDADSFGIFAISYDEYAVWQVMDG